MSRSMLALLASLLCAQTFAGLADMEETDLDEARYSNTSDPALIPILKLHKNDEATQRINREISQTDPKSGPTPTGPARLPDNNSYLPPIDASTLLRQPTTILDVTPKR